MPRLEDCVPVSWPSGPLATALAGDVSAEVRQAYEVWHRPDALAFLKGSPINCLVVDWAANHAKDNEQQASLKPLLAAARTSGLLAIGKVTGPCGAECARNAKQYGVSALLGEDGGGSPDAGVPWIPVSTASRTSEESAAPIHVLTKTLWPRVPGAWKGRTGNREERVAAAAAAGPTGARWVDSNGWASTLARARAPKKTIWIAAEPPKDAALLRGEDYALAVADAEAYGARWLVSLDAALRLQLAQRTPEALAIWKQTASALAFFGSQRAAIAEQVDVATLGILSDFAGPNETLASEVLNLCNRRHLPFRVLTKPDPAPASLQGLKAVLQVEVELPQADRLAGLRAWTKAGGLWILPSSSTAMAREAKKSGVHERGYDLYPWGEGRLAIARKPWSDPYTLAADAHALLGRRYDPIRLFNAGSTNARYSRSANESGRVQITNYAGRVFGHPMSLYVAQPYRAATIVRLGAPPEPAAITKKESGVEVELPPFPIYSAVDFTGS